MSRQPDRVSAPSVTIYRADSRFGEGPIIAFKHLVRELIHYRYHIATIFVRDFRATYRGTLFGAFWSFLLPLIPISIYYLLASFRVLPGFEGIPDSLAIVFNATVWFLLADCVRQPISVVRSRNAEVMKTALPLSVSITSSFVRALFDTGVRVVLLVGVVVATGMWPYLLGVVVLPVLAIGLIFFLGLGLLASIINIVAPDVERIVAIALQYGIFLSGVIFPLSKFGPLEVLEMINPFSVFISATRHLTFHGTIVNVIPLAAWSVAGIIIFLYAARLFYLMEYRIRGVQ